MAHTEIIRTVEHTAVGVAPAADKVAVTLGGSGEHARAVKVFCNERFGRFGAEVAEEHNKRVASGGLYIGHGGEHVLLILHGDGALIQRALIGRGNGAAAVLRKLHGEAVAADGDDAELYFGDVFKHGIFLLNTSG